MKTNSPYRPLSSQSSSFRLFEDNYKEVVKLCQTSGRKPADELRDLIDEALRARAARLTANPATNRLKPRRWRRTAAIFTARFSNRSHNTKRRAST